MRNMKTRGAVEKRGAITMNMSGKTKKFGMERLCAIIDYLLNLYAQGCQENLDLNRSIDYCACINQMVDEGLLKKSTTKKGEG